MRIIYGYCNTGTRAELAVMLIGGDKATLGNVWYPRHINEAEARLTSTAGTTEN